MTRLARISLGSLALLVGLALALPACGALLTREPGPTGHAAGKLLDCPASPNCVNSQSASSDDEHAIAALAFSGDPDASFADLTAFVRDTDGGELLVVEPGYLHAVYRTSFMRWADDVEFLLDAPASVIHVRSASRIGHSDLGANRARIESLRARWTPPR